jgi:hypothetical protein
LEGSFVQRLITFIKKMEVVGLEGIKCQRWVAPMFDNDCHIFFFFFCGEKSLELNSFLRFHNFKLALSLLFFLSIFIFLFFFYFFIFYFILFLEVGLVLLYFALPWIHLELTSFNMTCELDTNLT